ncbi:hypothetical protein TNCV_2459031 [Trichonephila clavipes]|nr:hypothetical protein TNCV_2459031 [Trichonephila clavipes]
MSVHHGTSSELQTLRHRQEPMWVGLFLLHDNRFPAGSGDTKFHPLPLCAALSHHRYPCSVTNVVNSGPFRFTPF